jgi:hypothetical protein
MAPGHITLKWCKEALQTIPRLRVFLIDGLRDRVRESTPCGVNEVKLRRGQIVREGLHTSLTDLRLRKNCKTARDRWHEICPGPSLFVVGRDKGKLSHFWRHSYQMARSGRYHGSVVNPDTGVPVYVGENRLLAADFHKSRTSEIIGLASEREEYAGLKPRRPIYSALWQADGTRIRRMAPLEFIGRYMPNWFDYAICDEAHQLANLSAGTNNGEERVRVPVRQWSDRRFLRIISPGCAIFGWSPKEVHTCQWKKQQSSGRGSNGSHTISRLRNIDCPQLKNGWQ